MQKRDSETAIGARGGAKRLGWSRRRSTSTRREGRKGGGGKLSALSSSGTGRQVAAPRQGDEVRRRSARRPSAPRRTGAVPCGKKVQQMVSGVRRCRCARPAAPGTGTIAGANARATSTPPATTTCSPMNGAGTRTTSSARRGRARKLESPESTRQRRKYEQVLRVQRRRAVGDLGGDHAPTPRVTTPAPKES